MSNQEPHWDGYVKWLRSKVGHENIYLVYTIALVVDDNGHLLVQERYDFDWLSVPGGVYEPDETIAQAVLRETLEETGIQCEIDRFLGVFSHTDYNLLYPNGDRVQPWTAAFVCRPISDEINVDGKETLDAAFRPIEEIYDRLPIQYQHAVDALQSGNRWIETPFAEDELTPYYQVLRPYVGQANVILPGCVAAILNEENEILMVRKIHKDRWSLPGGLSDLGETTTHTVQRELREELNVGIDVHDIIGIYSHPDLMYLKLASGDEIQTVDLLFECQLASGDITPDGEEIASAEFMPIDKALNKIGLHPLHQQMLEDIKNRNQKPFIR